MTNKQRWRLLPWRADDAYTCMAIDKTIAESTAAGAPPTIRFYGWAGKGAVSYGASQTVTDFDTAFCEKEEIAYVRRFTGGAVLYHSSSDITYALAAPVSFYPNRFAVGNETTKRIQQFLKELGIENSADAGITSVLVNGRKISASVPYYEQRKALFQHGSVFCAAEYQTFAAIFQQDEEAVRAKITTLRDEGVLGDTRSAFERIFLEDRMYDPGILTQQELARVAELRQEFSREEWNFREGKNQGICSMKWGVSLPELVRRTLEKI